MLEHKYVVIFLCYRHIGNWKLSLHYALLITLKENFKEFEKNSTKLLFILQQTIFLSPYDTDFFSSCIYRLLISPVIRAIFFHWIYFIDMI